MRCRRRLRNKNLSTLYVKHTFVLTTFCNHYHLNTLGAMEIISDVSLLMGERNDGKWSGAHEGC